MSKLRTRERSYSRANERMYMLARGKPLIIIHFFIVVTLYGTWWYYLLFNCAWILQLQLKHTSPESGPDRLDGDEDRSDAIPVRTRSFYFCIIIVVTL